MQATLGDTNAPSYISVGSFYNRKPGSTGEIHFRESKITQCNPRAEHYWTCPRFFAQEKARMQTPHAGNERKKFMAGLQVFNTGFTASNYFKAPETLFLFNSHCRQKTVVLRKG